MINLSAARLDNEPVLEARSVNDDGLERLRVSVDNNRQRRGRECEGPVRRSPGILGVVQQRDRRV